MSKQDTMQNALCRELGKDYCIRTIDMERCIYRDFGNGFNVEVSGMRTSSMRKRANLYLWFGDGYGAIIVRTVYRVERSAIGSVCDELLEYSEQLLAAGYNDAHSLLHMMYPELCKE